MSRHICPKCRRELSALQTCPWCARVAVALTEVDRVSELQARVALLEAALRGLSSDLDRVLAMRSTLGRTEWLTTIAEKARRALEVEP